MSTGTGCRQSALWEISYFPPPPKCLAPSSARGRPHSGGGGGGFCLHLAPFWTQVL